MKKIILLVFLFTSILSCSDNDSNTILGQVSDVDVNI